jgi:hypothetical protein
LQVCKNPSDAYGCQGATHLPSWCPRRASTSARHLRQSRERCNQCWRRPGSYRRYRKSLRTISLPVIMAFFGGSALIRISSREICDFSRELWQLWTNKIYWLSRRGF